MDLTKQFPRSPYDTIAGIVMMPRTLDKCKAYNAGTLGEYHYNCPLDKALFEFLKIDSETFAKKVKELKDDEKPVYEITGKKEVKIFGLFKTEIQVKTQKY